MNVPVCRVHCVGEVTAWGRQFLGALESIHLIEVSYESVQEFISGLSAPLQPVIIVVENTQEARKSIEKLRASGRHFFLVWFGKGFSKEDYVFGLEARAYGILEHARPDDKKVHECFRRAATNLDVVEQYDQLLHSLKALLLQTENDESTKAFMHEVRAAVQKLETCGLYNELHAGKADPRARVDGYTPFHKTQDFGDALTTVGDLERTGTLFVRGQLPGQEGKIDFIQGKVILAQTGDVHGVKAIYRMFLWDEPRFLFSRKDPNDCQVDEPMKESLKHIRHEGERLRRRFEDIRRELPPPDLHLGLEPSSLHTGCRLDAAEFSTLATVVEFGKVSQVIDYNEFPDVVVYECLIRLKKQNIIRVAIPA